MISGTGSGAGSGSVSLTEGSGSGRLKNIKHMDLTDPDPQHCKIGRYGTSTYSIFNQNSSNEF
jgi:hypothetical protein